jgi:1A family penicillin-binding protein
MRRETTYIYSIKNDASTTAKRIIKYILLYPVTFFVLTILLFSFVIYKTYANDISSKDVLVNRANTGLTLTDDKGETFFTFYNARNTNYVTLDKIPSHTRQALISSEDRDFYNNPGFSIKGIVRAFIKNVRHQEIKEGGSTISQELIKMQVLGPEKSLKRKFKELILSINLNRKYSKDEILEMYLNTAYFGEGAFGIANAAEVYFNKEAKDLTVAESAFLVGLLPAPSTLSPFSNEPEFSYVRQKLVLKAMLEEEYISKEQYDQELNYTLAFNKQPVVENSLAPHFAIYVKNQLIEKYGEEEVIRNGYVVKTTLNSEWQKHAEKTVHDHVQTLTNQNASNGSAVVIDPRSGQIKVMVGSHNWYDEKNGMVNMAISPRQPGSSFKPLMYAKALEQRKIATSTLINDVPKTFEGGYKPQNYDKKYRGPVTVRRALSNSLNVPAVEIMNDLGVQQGIATAHSFGINAVSNDASLYGNSLVLGSAEVPLVQMVSAYGAFANKGNQYAPTSILKVEDKFGSVLFENKTQSKKVLSEGAAFLVTSILSDTSSRREVFGSSLDTEVPAAVKTGTSELYVDSWTIGYTDDVVVGVWVGNNDHTPMDRVAGKT